MRLTDHLKSYRTVIIGERDSTDFINEEKELSKDFTFLKGENAFIRFQIIDKDGKSLSLSDYVQLKFKLCPYSTDKVVLSKFLHPIDKTNSVWELELVPRETNILDFIKFDYNIEADNNVEKCIVARGHMLLFPY